MFSPPVDCEPAPGSIARQGPAKLRSLRGRRGGWAAGSGRRATGVAREAGASRRRNAAPALGESARADFGNVRQPAGHGTRGLRRSGRAVCVSGNRLMARSRLERIFWPERFCRSILAAIRLAAAWSPAAVHDRGNPAWRVRPARRARKIPALSCGPEEPLNNSAKLNLSSSPGWKRTSRARSALAWINFSGSLSHCAACRYEVPQ